MIDIPDFLIISAVRYAIGRRSYITGITVDWVLQNWNEIPESAKTIFMRDIQEAFDHHERKLNSELMKRNFELMQPAFDPKDFISPLGDSCDIAQWQRLLEKQEG